MNRCNLARCRMHAGLLVAALVAFAFTAAPASAAEPGVHNPNVVPTAPAHPPLPAFTQSTNAAVMLDFEGLGNQEPVENFYDGGLGGNGSGPGPAWGITFSPNALALIDEDAGGTGNFGGEPSPDTVLFFLTGAAATMNVPGGFDTGFSFYYSAINNPGQIVVYDGLDATGNVLATLNLPLTPYNGAPDPTGDFSPLVPYGVSFSGTARSIDFAGTANQVVFDNITLGTAIPIGPGPGTVLPPYTPVPTLSPAWLAALAALMLMLGAGWMRRRQRRHLN